jgi:proteasome assembly chaperone (PAC2) family protein
MLGLNLDRRPDLRDPVLVAAFVGWNDAGEGASAAVRWLVRRLPAQRMGSIDPEFYHDFTSTRPTVRAAGSERRITWPLHELFYYTDPEQPRDLVLLVAREPELRWRTYSETLLHVMGEVGASSLVTLGAFLGDTPHSRPVPVTAFATTDDLRAELYSQGLGLSNYEGDTGIVSVLHQFARSAGLPSASLWAAVPQYLPTTANPKAALALVRELRTLLGLTIDLQRLEAASSFFQRQVDEAIGRDRRATGYIRELERQSDDEPDKEPRRGRGRADLPSADEVIRDLEAFLRTSREDDDNGDAESDG